MMDHTRKTSLSHEALGRADDLTRQTHWDPRRALALVAIATEARIQSELAFAKLNEAGEDKRFRNFMLREKKGELYEIEKPAATKRGHLYRLASRVIWLLTFGPLWDPILESSDE